MVAHCEQDDRLLPDQMAKHQTAGPHKLDDHHHMVSKIAKERRYMPPKWWISVPRIALNQMAERQTCPVPMIPARVRAANTAITPPWALVENTRAL